MKKIFSNRYDSSENANRNTSFLEKFKNDYAVFFFVFFSLPKTNLPGMKLVNFVT